MSEASHTSSNPALREESSRDVERLTPPTVDNTPEAASVLERVGDSRVNGDRRECAGDEARMNGEGTFADMSLRWVTPDRSP
jgi:hypothetical protein